MVWVPCLFLSVYVFQVVYWSIFRICIIYWLFTIGLSAYIIYTYRDISILVTQSSIPILWFCCLRFCLVYDSYVFITCFTYIPCYYTLCLLWNSITYICLSHIVYIRRYRIRDTLYWGFQGTVGVIAGLFVGRISLCYPVLFIGLHNMYINYHDISVLYHTYRCVYIHD
jgi:hypothetical protein